MSVARTFLAWSCLATVLLCVVPDARGGAWLRDPGGWYLRASWLAHQTRERADCAGESVAAEPFGGRYREQMAFVYAEWGASQRITLVGSFGYKDATIEDAAVPDYGTRSTTDLRLGSRLGLRRGAWPVSLEVMFAVPTYPRTDPTRPVGGREQFLPAGSGRLETEMRVLVGRSLHPLPLYTNLDLGYRLRSAPFGDQWLLAWELGGQWRRWFAKSELRALLPTGDLCASASAGAITFHERNLRWAPEIAFRVGSRTWLGVGASIPWSIRNALEGTQWAVSLAWQRPGRAPAESAAAR